jgi:hypothetical protein
LGGMASGGGGGGGDEGKDRNRVVQVAVWGRVRGLPLLFVVAEDRSLTWGV